MPAALVKVISHLLTFFEACCLNSGMLFFQTNSANDAFNTRFSKKKKRTRNVKSSIKQDTCVILTNDRKFSNICECGVKVNTLRVDVKAKKWCYIWCLIIFVFMSRLNFVI